MREHNSDQTKIYINMSHKKKNFYFLQLTTIKSKHIMLVLINIATYAMCFTKIICYKNKAIILKLMIL